jgi:hypothetical protein
MAWLPGYPLLHRLAPSTTALEAGIVTLNFGFGYLAGRHELLLYGIELEHRKDDCGEDPVSACSCR